MALLFEFPPPYSPRHHISSVGGCYVPSPHTALVGWIAAHLSHWSGLGAMPLAPHPALGRALRAGYVLLSDYALSLWLVADAVMGGVTDAQYLFGLGLAHGWPSTPAVIPGLP